ncbi:hypothetical protein MMC27_001828 [Xylographa pallens]|nr:hypothetical protein [Xylographa pallens]
MSQGVMNRSFEALVTQLPGVAAMYYDHEHFGQLDAEMNAPRVLLNGNTSNATEAFYQLRIKSGTATLPNKRVLPLKDWVITVRAPLNEVTLSITGEDAPDLQIEKQQVLEGLKQKYPGFTPGDYSVQRVFCALSSAKWTDPDGQLSSCKDPDSGKIMKLSQFIMSSEANKRSALDLFDLLKRWANFEASQEISTLGIKFELDKKNINPQIPTFKPVHIFTQVYPYLDSDVITGVMDTGDGEIMSKGDYNCLAYCENVDVSWDPWMTPSDRKDKGVITRALPVQPKLPWSGNLASPADSKTQEVRGSFAMDYRVFLERFLLPQLQELCQANQFYVGSPERGFSDGSKYLQPSYSVGCQLAGSSPSYKASDRVFAFNKTSESEYKWEQSRSSQSNRKNAYEYTSPASFLGIIKWNDTEGYGDHDIYSNSKVTVSWAKGGQSLDVKGWNEYFYHIRFGSNRQMSDGISEKKYRLTGTWSLKIQLNDPVNGVLEPVVEGLEPGTSIPKDTLVAESEVSNSGGIIGETKQAVTKKLKWALGEGIRTVITNVSTRFGNAGKLVFPGHGQLRFNHPVLTSNGSILAYADYEKPSADGTVYFAEVEKKKWVAPTVRVPKTDAFPVELVDKQKPRLHWAPSFDYNHEEKLGRLTFTVTNETNTALLFSYIKVELVAAAARPGKAIENAGLCLFNGVQWEKSNKSLGEHLNDWISNIKAFFKAKHETPPDAPSTAQQSSVSEETLVAESTKGEKQATTEPSQEPPPSKEKFLYTFEPEWENANPKVTNASQGSESSNIEFVIKKADGTAFEFPKGKRFTLVLQGKVESIGQYPIRIHESWKKKPGEITQPGVAPFAVDFKIAEILEDGTYDCWDLSDKLDELAKQEDAKKQTALN